MTASHGPAAAAVEALSAAHPGAVQEVQDFRGEATVVVAPERILDALAFLRDRVAPRFAFLTDLTALDRLPQEPRFEVVYLVTALDPPARLRLKARLSADAPEIASATSLWPAADWLEREVYDFFGIRFRGHPDLTRILMPDDWEGHPLRKDFPLVEEPVEFVGRVPKPPSRIIPDVPPKGS
ncbi:MAG TPA: NADH-quinone oxidoreductase subunit C [bacterium]|jgi:NADH-quinone oxidoreductase subunit C|nr:NADH-quinone oxidoreductase subunit C [bacterium]